MSSAGTFQTQVGEFQTRVADLPAPPRGPLHMRVGVVGVGRIGSFHAGLLPGHPAVAQVRVTDPDLDRAEAVAREIHGSTAPSVDALLAGVDAVVITAPTITHAHLIRQAVDAGLPTFCEKPITIDLA